MIEYYIGAFAFVFFLNIPFGYWKANTRKFSRGWALSIHVPVVAVIITRLLLDALWIFIPIFFVTFFLGQFTGSGVRKFLLRKKTHLSSCLVMDLIRFAHTDDGNASWPLGKGHHKRTKDTLPKCCVRKKEAVIDETGALS